MEEAKTRILVIDDQRMIRELLKGWLTIAGYEVHAADDGDVGLEMLENPENDFDVVLLDRRMPRMEGIEVLKRMKANPALKDIPVIMETAADSEEEIAEGISAGAYYYLTKPLQPNVMLSIVASAVDEALHVKKLQGEMEKHRLGLRLLTEAAFKLRTPSEADDLTILLANVCPDPESRVLGLTELLINAIEHGNLGITYSDKTELVTAGQWKDEVQRRLESAEYSERYVSVTYQKTDERIEITIEDQGDGFDWEKYMEMDPKRAFDPHGRGIALANAMSFDLVTYMGKGNVVRGTIHLAGEGGD